MGKTLLILKAGARFVKEKIGLPVISHPWAQAGFLGDSSGKNRWPSLAGKLFRWPVGFSTGRKTALPAGRLLQ